MDYENIIIPIIALSAQKYLGSYSFILLLLIPLLKLIDFRKLFKKSITCKIYKEHTDGGNLVLFSRISIAIENNICDNFSVREE